MLKRAGRLPDEHRRAKLGKGNARAVTNSLVWALRQQGIEQGSESVAAMLHVC